MRLIGEIAFLRLLQLADSALAIGGTAHSFGLETLGDEGSPTPEDVEAFLNAYLEEAGVLDAVFVRRSCDVSSSILETARERARPWPPASRV